MPCFSPPLPLPSFLLFFRSLSLPLISMCTWFWSQGEPRAQPQGPCEVASFLLMTQKSLLCSGPLHSLSPGRVTCSHVSWAGFFVLGFLPGVCSFLPFPYLSWSRVPGFQDPSFFSSPSPDVGRMERQESTSLPFQDGSPRSCSWEPCPSKTCFNGEKFFFSSEMITLNS